ncbi:MAG: DUF2520 domain-containing protein [Prevotella sp.]|nr:DUF2520 domain-containing protein [Prevotella sp.]
MRIVYVGAGNLATNLAQELNKQYFRIVQVYSRTIAAAEMLADRLGCPATNAPSEIVSDADLYIFSVTDDALPGLLKQMPSNNGLWAHTAGSIPMSVFEPYSENFGVVYPFQTFSKSRKVDFRQIPFFIEANTPDNLEKLREMCSRLSSSVAELSSERRRILHLTGVFACNFSNHLYTISKKLLDNANIPFDALLPLIDETAAKIHTLPPAAAQTGPAVRYDKKVIDGHLAMLYNSRWQDIYRLMSEDIYETSKQMRNHEFDKLRFDENKMLHF